ncbi:hypothetical protein [Lampropedia aestuarii]|uniref:hypothetical protein n=1 Tax=Lampropedia aestuarii TaxID=2562762 RepID=UPI002468F963|nr:hypothetical protein [Lampropedia aestuarii]MDH5855682.1 hypothetical protein [Lampropedia aestuarii]
MKKVLAAFLALIGIHQHLTAEQKQDLASAAWQASPAAAASGVTKAWGLPLSEWLVVASIAFIALQAFYLIWKWRRDYVRTQERRADRERLAAMARAPAAVSDTDLCGLETRE